MNMRRFEELLLIIMIIAGLATAAIACFIRL